MKRQVTPGRLVAVDGINGAGVESAARAYAKEHRHDRAVCVLLGRELAAVPRRVVHRLAIHAPQPQAVGGQGMAISPAPRRQESLGVDGLGQRGQPLRDPREVPVVQPQRQVAQPVPVRAAGIGLDAVLVERLDLGADAEMRKGGVH